MSRQGTSYFCMGNPNKCPWGIVQVTKSSNFCIEICVIIAFMCLTCVYKIIFFIMDSLNNALRALVSIALFVFIL